MKKFKRVLKEGDHVKLRGREPKGILTKLNEKWARVMWQTEVKGPDLVHVDELELALMYPDDGGLKKPVRKYEDTFSAVTLLKQMFFGEKS